MNISLWLRKIDKVPWLYYLERKLKSLDYRLAPVGRGRIEAGALFFINTKDTKLLIEIVIEVILTFFSLF